MDPGCDSRGPCVIEAPLVAVSPHGFIPSLHCEVEVHMDAGELVVGPSCSGIEVLLLEFPGSSSVGTKKFSVTVNELGPLVIPSMGVEWVAVSLVVDWVREGVGVVVPWVLRDGLQLV